jgi:GNAT superfamily N-acetyltransferase
MSEVSVQVGLPDRWRSDTARLYYEAFRRKTNFLFGSREKTLAVLESDFAAEQAVIAVQDDRLVGLAGIQHGGPFLNMHFKTYVRVFGRFTACWRYALALLFHRTPRPGELVMDGIAVDETLRGQGVGTKLLNGVTETHRHPQAQRVMGFSA